MVSNRTKLLNLENRIGRAIFSVHGHVTAEEATEVERLRLILGEAYDPVNMRWYPYPEQDE